MFTSYSVRLIPSGTRFARSNSVRDETVETDVCLRIMLKRLLVLGILLGLVQGYGFSQGIEEPIVVTQIPFPDPENAPVALSKTERSNFGEEARIVLLSPGRNVRVLTKGFASASDPSVSFDGKRILFAGKRRAEDHWNIFEMSLDGSGLRQITAIQETASFRCNGQACTRGFDRYSTRQISSITAISIADITPKARCFIATALYRSWNLFTIGPIIV